ncbi:hypothetical protein MRX96_030846 [Rhipicephalus microplus]
MRTSLSKTLTYADVWKVSPNLCSLVHQWWKVGITLLYVKSRPDGTREEHVGLALAGDLVAAGARPGRRAVRLQVAALAHRHADEATAAEQHPAARRVVPRHHLGPHTNQAATIVEASFGHVPSSDGVSFWPRAGCFVRLAIILRCRPTGGPDLDGKEKSSTPVVELPRSSPNGH